MEQFRSDLTPEQQAELNRALLIVRMAEDLKGTGFCMGSETRARKILKRYSVEDTQL